MKVCTENIEIAFADLLSGKSRFEFAGGEVYIVWAAERENNGDKGIKALYFDSDKIPQNAVVRYRRTGDKFVKFGGGTVSLSDFLTDKKVPQSLRGALPLVCLGSEVFIVGGVEISEKIKVTADTVNRAIFICNSPFALG